MELTLIIELWLLHVVAEKLQAIVVVHQIENHVHVIQEEMGTNIPSILLIIVNMVSPEQKEKLLHGELVERVAF